MNPKSAVERSAAAVLAALILLSGCKKKEEAAPPPAATPAAKPAIVSAEKNSFNEVTSKLDPGGNLFVYLSTEQALNGLSNKITAASNLVGNLPDIPGDGRHSLDSLLAVLGAFVSDSGISHISGLGMSSIAREPGFYYSKIVLHHYPGQNDGPLWSVFGQASHPMPMLDMLPQDTALAMSSDFDLGLAWTNIMSLVNAMNQPLVEAALDGVPEKFHQGTGLDWYAMVQSLGGEFGLVVTLDENKKVTVPLSGNSTEIPSPAAALVIKVKSDLIFDRVDKALQANQMLNNMTTKVDEPGLRMRTVALPLPLKIEVRPTLARSGDYLILASTDSLIRQMLAVQSGKTNGFKTTDEFKRLSQGIPDRGNSFYLAAGNLSSTLGNMTNQASSAEVMKALHQMFPTSTNSAGYSVGAFGPDGWEGISNGSQSLENLLAPAAMLVGIATAIAVEKAAHPKQPTSEIDIPKAGSSAVSKLVNNADDSSKDGERGTLQKVTKVTKEN